MPKLLLVLSVFILSFTAHSSPKENKDCVKEWEYFSKNYQMGHDDSKTANWRISAGFSKAGKEGWELVSILPLGGYQYAVFKRQKSTCVDDALLKENKGLKRPS